MISYIEEANADPSWLTLLERLGLPVFLILFGCLVVWKLLPHVINWFVTQTKTAGIMSDSIPDIKESLHKLANEGQQTLKAIDERTKNIQDHQKTLEVVDQRTKLIEDRLERIEDRLPAG